MSCDRCGVNHERTWPATTASGASTLNYVGSFVHRCCSSRVGHSLPLVSERTRRDVAFDAMNETSKVTVFRGGKSTDACFLKDEQKVTIDSRNKSRDGLSRRPSSFRRPSLRHPTSPPTVPGGPALDRTTPRRVIFRPPDPPRRPPGGVGVARGEYEPEYEKSGKLGSGYQSI